MNSSERYTKYREHAVVLAESLIRTVMENPIIDGDTMVSYYRKDGTGGSNTVDNILEEFVKCYRFLFIKF